MSFCLTSGSDDKETFAGAKVQKFFDICKFIYKIYVNPHKIAGKGRRSGTPVSRNTGISAPRRKLGGTSPGEG